MKRTQDKSVMWFQKKVRFYKQIRGQKNLKKETHTKKNFKKVIHNEKNLKKESAIKRTLKKGNYSKKNLIHNEKNTRQAGNVVLEESPLLQIDTQIKEP